MKIRATLCAALIAAGSMVACVSKGPSPSVPMQNYDVTVSLAGPIALAPTSLGVIKVPQGATGLASLGLVFASLYLKEQTKGNCTFTPAVETTVAGVVTASATGTCNLNGVPITETVALTVSPVAATE